MTLEITQSSSNKYPILAHTIIRLNSIKDLRLLYKYWKKIERELKYHKCKAYFKFKIMTLSLYHISYWEDDDSMKAFVRSKAHKEAKHELKGKMKFMFYYGTAYK